VVVATPRSGRCRLATMRERRREVQLYRGQVPSPWRPTVAWREDWVRFWAAIARGVTTDDAAVEAGVSSPVAFRWFRHAGGVNPCLAPIVSGRYLSFVEREDIAILRAQGLGVREIARRLDRDPSTISRELRRNASTRTWRLEYKASIAQWHAEWPAGRKWPSWPPTSGSASTCRTDCRVWLLVPMVGRLGRKVPSGRARTSRIVGIAGGCRGGVRSRSRIAFGSTSPMMSPCGSATRRSTRPSTSRAAVRCAVSWSHACARVGRCGSHARGLARRPGLTSRPR
jgi:hypothetical protein